MPELPEVETTARGLRARLVGLAVTDVGGVDWPRMLPNADEGLLRDVLTGRALEAVDRRGKYLLLEFGGPTLALHRKMSGNVLVRPADSEVERHTHLRVAFDDGAELRFVDARKFGRVYLFADAAEQAAFLAERLGPEPLIGLDGRALASRLAGRRARIKTLLLDQSVLAGVGNLYADEALWEARIHPERAADSLSRAELKRLAEAIGNVLRQGIERRGTSFSTYLDAAGEEGENQLYLKAYGRAGQPCERCGRALERIVIAQRSSHLCPRCQRR